MGAFLEKTLAVAGEMMAQKKANALIIAEGGGYGSYRCVGECTNELQKVLANVAFDNQDVAAMICYTYAQILAANPDIEKMTDKLVEELRNGMQ